MTKLWFAISVGSGREDSAWLHSIVIDAHPVVKDEIWSITLFFLATSTTQVFYVLEPTCEVVGHATPASSAKTPIEAPLRADWSAYIEQRASASQTSECSSLMDHVKWANYEEYDRGISRLWLNRIVKEGEMGAAKRQVAVRYIIACVVGNRFVSHSRQVRVTDHVSFDSVSGTWMSVNDMAQ